MTPAVLALCALVLAGAFGYHQGRKSYERDMVRLLWRLARFEYLTDIERDELLEYTRRDLIAWYGSPCSLGLMDPAPENVIPIRQNQGE